MKSVMIRADLTRQSLVILLTLVVSFRGKSSRA